VSPKSSVSPQFTAAVPPLPQPSTEHPEGQTGEEIEHGTRLGIDAIDGDVPHHYFTRPELECMFAAFNILSLKHKQHASEKDPSRPAASWSLLAKLE